MAWTSPHPPESSPMTTHHNPLAHFNHRQSPHRKPGIPGTTPSRAIVTTIIAAALTLSTPGLAQAGPYPHPTPQD